MVRELCKDVIFLAQKSRPATADDLPVAQDLLDTLIAHKDGCVGMAANMIGESIRIIAFERSDGSASSIPTRDSVLYQGDSVLVCVRHELINSFSRFIQG